jgi:putative tryptophan/tyrosine transport system substrate-binding protein
MRRREFIAGLGSVAAWPLAARAQQDTRMRRIGVLQTLAAEDPLSQAQTAAFAKALRELGWIDGRTLRIDYRFAAADADRTHSYAAELVALAPDVVLATGAAVTRAFQQASRTVPIVFVVATDPVGDGLVATQARPGGNTTGFAFIEYGTSVKWLQLLKAIAPNVRRASVIRDPTLTVSAGQLGAMQGVAPLLGVELSAIDSRDADEMARAIAAFAGGPDGGLAVLGAAAIVHRDLIITLAARHRLPAIYGQRVFVTSGGLISYGIDTIDPFRGAAGYVDRILKGERPADLPVQAPTKYEMVINLKTAKALGLTIPETLLATADEVIQ